MENTPIFILLSILLQGCIYQYHPSIKYKTYIQEEDLGWLVADTCLLFHSDRGRVDTVRSAGYRIQHDTIQADRLFTCSNGNIKFFITECVQRMDSDNTCISVTFRRWLGNSDKPDIQVYNRFINTKKFTMNGKSYDECIVIDDWDTDSLFYYTRNKGLNVSNAVFAKNIGLIYYKMENGEEFFRKFD